MEKHPFSYSHSHSPHLLFQKSSKSNLDSSDSFYINKDPNRNSPEESSFIVSKRRRHRKSTNTELTYIEHSPNGKFSRTDLKNHSEKYHTAFVGIDNDRGCEITWHELNVSTINDIKTINIYNELIRLKTISNEDCLNTITDVWLRDDKRVIIFITDYFGMGTLRQYLSKIGKQKLKVIKEWIINILRALKLLHSANLIFGGLNCSRILFNGTSGKLAIKDLFVASDAFYQSFNEKPYELFPLHCMCPELIKTLKVNNKSDIYSLGMVIIEIITLEIPYADITTEEEIMSMKLNGELPSAFHRIMDDEVKCFLLKMLAYEPNERSDIESLLRDEFLKITKDDYRVIKVKNGKKKRKSKRCYKYNGGGDEFNLKNYVLYKEFKEEPYIEEMRYLIEQERRNEENRKRRYRKGKERERKGDMKRDLVFSLDKDNEEYKIVDEDYNVFLKILIKEEGKISEIQFTYNLLKDSIENLMEEIKSEFCLNKDNLNHIYETLKKVTIYSKLCKEIELLPNNSC